MCVSILLCILLTTIICRQQLQYRMSISRLEGVYVYFIDIYTFDDPLPNHVAMQGIRVKAAHLSGRTVCLSSLLRPFFRGTAEKRVCTSNDAGKRSK